jgi:glycine cleavage system H protein
MPLVRGCNLPDELLYDVDNHIWFKELDDGTVRLGMTTVATAMAGQLVAFTPKKVGRSVEAGKSCATVESGKWVGPAKSAAGGEIVAVNEALVERPALANEDPYGAGWLVVIKPGDWAGVKAALSAGAEVAAKYEAKMAADGFAGCACAVAAKP